MTGFARADGAHDGYRWTWEVKSVNSRNLDLRFRLPPGSDDLEARARAAAPAKFARGNVSINLSLKRPERGQRVQVNREALDRMLALVDELKDETGAEPVRIEGLLALPGMLESVDDGEETEESRESRTAALAASLDQAFDRLAETRAEEGGRLAEVMTERLDEIAGHCAAAESTAAAQPEAVHRRLRAQLAELLGGDAPVPEERLAQEVALLATRADVREELDRLAAHVASARDLMKDGGAVGRRLDFLCQEFNREANTLCSKSSDMELTRIGLDLKAAIERLREQVQNIE